LRKMLGAGNAPVGVLAAAALYALGNHRSRLVEDHEHAKLFARELRKFAETTGRPCTTPNQHRQHRRSDERRSASCLSRKEKRRARGSDWSEQAARGVPPRDRTRRVSQGGRVARSGHSGDMQRGLAIIVFLGACAAPHVGDFLRASQGRENRAYAAGRFDEPRDTTRTPPNRRSAPPIGRGALPQGRGPTGELRSWDQARAAYVRLIKKRQIASVPGVRPSIWLLSRLRQVTGRRATGCSATR